MASRPASTAWSKWANRFVIAAIALGAMAAGATAWLLYDNLYPSNGGIGSAKVVAAGGAGTWLTVGYLGFIIFGPIACAVTALFYQHLEVNLKAPYTGLNNVLAWLHLVLMNVGVTAATWIMMNGGYRAGSVLGGTVCRSTPTDPSCNVHVLILSGLEDPIGISIAIAILGAFAGGIGYVIAWRRGMKAMKASA
jgi:hypothetical protein